MNPFRRTTIRAIGFGFGLILLMLPLVTPTKVLAKQQPFEFPPQDLEFFESKVRPILVEKCFECHGPEASPLQGGLSLATRATVLTGGDTGPAIVAGDALNSLLIDAINYGEVYEMPPDTKLATDEIEILTKWVQLGAPWPNNPDVVVQTAKEFNLDERKSNHWCWQPIKSTAIPVVKNASWPADSIDNFILQKIEAAGLTPAKPADRRTLIRRVYFDLIGLPPTVTQVQSFLDDDSPTAFEKVVDHLLASPAFGEHWARHWMDLTRYAETYGHEFDYEIEQAYRYRDYLIRAFNFDVPYNQFVHEHIAGDLLQQPRLNPEKQFNESIVGTGFWFLGEATHSPVDVRADEAGRIDNQIDVMSKTFLGLTVACARCHDHKFDAISTEDYYALAGFLQSSRRQLAMLDPYRKIELALDAAIDLSKQGDSALKELIARLQNADAKRIAKYVHASLDFLRTDSKETPDLPAIVVAHEVDADLLNRLMEGLRTIESNEQVSPAINWWRVGSKASQQINNDFADSISRQIDERGQQLTKWQEQSILFEDFANGLPADWFRTGFAFEPDGRSEHIFAPVGQIARSTGTIHSGIGGSKFQGVVRSPTFKLEHESIHYRLRGHDVTIRLIIDGYVMDVFNSLLFKGVTLTVKDADDFVWQTQAEDLKNHLGHTAHIEIIDNGNGYVELDEIRFSDNAQPPPPLALAVESAFARIENGDFSLREFSEIVSKSLIQQMLRERISGDRELASWVIKNNLNDLFEPSLDEKVSSQPNLESASFVSASTRESNDDNKTTGGLLAELSVIREKIATLNQATPDPELAIAITDGSSEDEHIFIRGNYKTLGEFAERRFLTAISGRPLKPARGSGRMELAQKITAPNNPLTSRVEVNRIWHHLLGQGIVDSVDNFGVLGKLPTHPELLDHLATGFMADGWSVKRMIRRIVLTQTYRMSSSMNTDVRTDEPANELLHSGVSTSRRSVPLTHSGVSTSRRSEPLSNTVDPANTVDPNNDLLHRARIKRLSGEAIRDSILQISGELDSTMFGPSVPIHLTPFMQGRGRPANSGPIDGKGRRSIYVSVRRNFLSAMMLAFDTPIPFNSIGKRNQSNVPAQALILMNDPFVVEQAKKWSKRLVTQQPGVEQRIEQIYLEALGRPPEELELENAKSFLQLQAKELGIAPAEIATDARVWRDFCHVVFNLKEFIFIE